MSKKTEDESTEKDTIENLKTQVDELTKVLSALISDIDDNHPGNCSSTFWWMQSFLNDLDVSDSLKRKLGLPIDDGDEYEDY